MFYKRQAIAKRSVTCFSLFASKGFFEFEGRYNKGGVKKSVPGVKSLNYSAKIGPTETYYIPNQWKLNKVFDELCRFEIAALLIEWNNQF